MRSKQRSAPDSPQLATDRVLVSPIQTALLVDDDSRFRKATRAVLQSHGFAVLEAGTKQEGLDRFCENLSSVSVVIVDWRLDAFDKKNNAGIELARDVKKIAPFTPIICVSGFHSSKEMNGLGLFDLYYEKGAPYGGLDASVDEVCNAANEFTSQLKALLPSYLRELVTTYNMTGEDELNLARQHYLENTQWRKQVTDTVAKRTKIFSELSIFRYVKWKLEIDRF